MFLRETRRTNRDGSVVSYLQLAHNERHPVSGNPVAKVIHSFGRADQVDRAALARLVSSISRFLTPEQAVDRDDRGAPVSPAEVEVLDSRRLGAAWTLDRIWERLGIGAAIRRVAAGRRLDGDAVERVVFALVAQRACEPGSKLAATGWVAERVAIDAARGSPTTPRTRRWTSCSTRWARSPPRCSARSPTCSILIWTSCSWTPPPPTGRPRPPTSSPSWPRTRRDDEVTSPTEAGTRAFGHSKDHRADLPQVVIAMAVTRDGVPVRCWTFPGNTADTAIIRTIKDDLGGWGLRRLVWVADRGFASAANRAYLTRGAGTTSTPRSCATPTPRPPRRWPARAATAPWPTTCGSRKSRSPPEGTATATTAPAPSGS